MDSSNEILSSPSNEEKRGESIGEYMEPLLKQKKDGKPIDSTPIAFNSSMEDLNQTDQIKSAIKPSASWKGISIKNHREEGVLNLSYSPLVIINGEAQAQLMQLEIETEEKKWAYTLVGMVLGFQHSHPQMVKFVRDNWTKILTIHQDFLHDQDSFS